ncbi:hypothetical protein GCM10009662_02980 [Catellatospora coxensis]|uniref:Uncharacterized protein n=2 Tax=Catellatospora coxensis TaxID=310354 RepID=A0A8J3KY34_9ACTN|nr:hypothetical protein Cco03nite_49930 [Catellatospora coxensis]
MVCRSCGDVILMRPEPRSCWCGASSGRYLDDRSTVEQSEGTLSIALDNGGLRDAVAAFDSAPQGWHPLMMFRAFLNPLSETDVRYVPRPAQEIPAADAPA